MIREYCPSCDRLVPLVDVGAYDFTMFCDACINRYGATALRETANAALSMRNMKKKERTCLRCSAPLVVGSDAMCAGCLDVYRQRFGAAGVRWS